MRNLILILSSILLAHSAHAAYYGVLDNGEVLESGRYKLTPDAQVLTKNGGLNLGATVEAGLNEEVGIRGLIGFGKTDFYAGGMVKWMPIPDIDNQPAIGFNIGLLYGKDSDVNDLTFRLEPLLSKKILVEQTAFTPYVSLPVGVRVRDTDDRYVDDDTEMTFQLVLGTQLQVEQWKNLQFLAEIGLDLDNSPAYLSVGAVMYFDDENGFTLQ